MLEARECIKREVNFMKPFPHSYNVSVEARSETEATISAEGLTSLASAPPAEFGGPGNLWSPETLLVGAVAGCFILTFQAIAATARFNWTEIHCDGSGVVDRAEGGVRFTGMLLYVRLSLPAGTDKERAQVLLKKAEKGCLIGNSLRFSPELRYEVRTEEVPNLLAS
jgi:peroxiredoxin-like protein